MNKIIYNLISITSLIALIILLGGFLPKVNNENNILKPFKSLNEHNNYSQLISTIDFTRNTRIKIFSISGGSDKQASNFVKNSVNLNIDKTTLKNIILDSPHTLDLIVPGINNSEIELLLSKCDVQTKDFESNLITENGLVPFKGNKGLFYRGIIKGNSESIASVSIFKEEIIALITDINGNYIIGPVKDKNNINTDEYIFYNDQDIVKKYGLMCGVEGRENLVKNASYYNQIKKGVNTDLLTHDTVRIYFVADYQLLLDNGGNLQQAENFIKGFFNSVSSLYRNEGIPVSISRIDYYTFPDPYRNMNDSYDILLAFGEKTKDNFKGDLAHLLSTYHNQQLGGIAWINVLCQSYNPQDNSGRFGFSNIEPSYNPYPIYSWTVMVVTHELGHNFASRHTHACVWPVYFNGYGSIDTCVITEENKQCYDSNTVAVPTTGTIMSYCHIQGNINFLNGFGTLPGDTVRLGYALSTCIDSAVNSNQPPVVYSLSQNYPNPYNPSTTISFTLPSSGMVSVKIYDIRGREIASLKDNEYYPDGTFQIIFNADNYKLASGVYLYKLTINNMNVDEMLYQQVKKMVLIK